MIAVPKLPAIAQARLQTVGLAYLGVSGVAAAALLGVMLFTPVGESIQQVVRVPVEPGHATTAIIERIRRGR